MDGLVLAGSTTLSLSSSGDIVMSAAGQSQTVRLSSASANGASGPLSFFPQITFDPITGIAVQASWSNGPNGVLGIVWAAPGSTIGTVLADTDTVVPNTSENFVSFMGQPALDGLGNIAFAGQGPTRQGVYRYRGGRLEVVADSSMTDPVTRARFVELGQPILDEGAVLFFGGEGELSTTLFRVDDSGMHALYSGRVDVQFDNGTTRTISVGESGVRPMAISNHLLAMVTLLPHEALAPAVVLLDVGIAGTDGGGEPPRDAGTTTTTTTTSGEGCNGGPKAALAPLWVLTALLAASRPGPCETAAARLRSGRRRGLTGSQGGPRPAPPPQLGFW